MRLPLAEISEPVVEALAVRLALAAGTAEAPLADDTRDVAGRLHPLAERDDLVGDRQLSLGLDLAVVADEGVPGVPSRQQRAT